MIYDRSQPVFPNWWDDLDAVDSLSETGGGWGGEGVGLTSGHGSSERGSRIDRDVPPAGFDAVDELGGWDRSDGLGACHDPEEPGSDRTPIGDRLRGAGGGRGGESEDGCEGWRRGYSRDLVDTVWEFGMVVAGNDPELWRKDEFGNWIHRFAYGQRGSRFGWEIFDPGVGRHHQGIRAMRPMQWEGYLRYCEALG